DVSNEPDKVRNAYGRNDFGQRLLLCRRLLEVGVSFVTCQYGDWDNHSNLFSKLKDTQMPKFDQGLTALINDLDEHGLLDSTMVIEPHQVLHTNTGRPIQLVNGGKPIKELFG